MANMNYYFERPSNVGVVVRKATPEEMQAKDPAVAGLREELARARLRRSLLDPFGEEEEFDLRIPQADFFARARQRSADLRRGKSRGGVSKKAGEA